MTGKNEDKTENQDVPCSDQGNVIDSLFGTSLLLPALKYPSCKMKVMIFMHLPLRRFFED